MKMDAPVDENGLVDKSKRTKEKNKRKHIAIKTVIKKNTYAYFNKNLVVIMNYGFAVIYVLIGHMRHALILILPKACLWQLPLNTFDIVIVLPIWRQQNILDFLKCLQQNFL